MNVKDCPSCGAESKVIDSRIAKRQGTLRRRRQCPNPACGRRWTTMEVYEDDVARLTNAERTAIKSLATRVLSVINKMDG